ncbi:MAG: SBBP repeat-containing protein [Acidobacteria bacterium]|nr:SBBP repeat-containing protein [Acidobacteriota bacterium]
MIRLLLLLGSVAQAGAAPARARFGNLPLSFERNRGQAGPGVEFVARGIGYRVFLSAGGMTVAVENTSLRMGLVGASATARAEGLDPLPGTSNYFTGTDPARWRTGIPTYRRVRFRDVYPGIELVYYGRQGRVEYDFVVGPGADTGRIELLFEGADGVEIGSAGDLVFRTPGGELRQHRPQVYQHSGGARRPVAGKYRLTGKNRVRFEVESYDRGRALVIDPVLSYSTYLGGSESDSGYGIAVDTAGNAYITGETRSANLPGAPGALQGSNGGGYDAFVIKLNAAGSAVVYATYLGGSGTDAGRSIAVDGAGNAYIAGFSASSNFPTTAGAFQRTNRGSQNVFVCKLNPAGSALVYSTFLGGFGRDYVTAIAVNAAGEAFVTGGTSSSNFPLLEPIQRDYRGGTGLLSSDAFVAKLNAAGSALVYSTYLGGASNDQGNGIAVDSAGSAYVAGQTASSGFPATAGAFQTSLGGFEDAFVVKINAAGSVLVYSTFLGASSASSRANAIGVDGGGNAYVTGGTQGTRFPTTPGAFQEAFPRNGSSTAFIVKLAPAGDALRYSSLIGGSGGTEGRGIALDPSGNAFVIGDTDAKDFPVSNPVQGALGTGSFRNAFVTALNAAGSFAFFSTYLGGEGLDYGRGIAMDRSGNVYLTGEAGSSRFPATGAVQGVKGGDLSDAFLAKIDFTVRAQFSAEGIVNAASFARGPVAPGEIVSIFGGDLGPNPGASGGLDAAGRLGSQVAETRVLFDGRPAPLFFTRYDQVNAQVPYSVAGKSSTQVQVSYQGVVSNTVAVPVAPSAPGLFALASGAGQGIAFNQDFTLNSRTNPALPGSVIILYATGEGQTDPAGIDGKLAESPFPVPRLPVAVNIGSNPADTLFAGSAPGFTGLLQVNARIASDTRLSGSSAVSLTVGGVSSQSGVTLAVGPKFTISSLRAAGTNSAAGARLVVTLDFDDASGSATRDDLRINFDINNGGLKGFGNFSREGVTPGQTSGTMTLSFTFPGARFNPVSNAPIVVSLVNGIGIESNQATGLFSAQ